MKNRLLFVFLLLSSLTFAQNDTVISFKIEKEDCLVFRGMDENIKNWYLFIDEYKYVYLANLEIDEEDVCKWFKLRKDSQSLLVSMRKTSPIEKFYMYRKNEPDTVNWFRYSISGSELFFESLDFEEVYRFRKINVQE